MQFEPYKIYHIYNQGNNKQRIFFTNNNYLYFLQAYRKLVGPYTETLAYCLMPNHFHFLIGTNDRSIQSLQIGSLALSQLSNSIRVLLSSYTNAINIQQHTTGSLFRQKTKAKTLETGSENYPFIAFNYIHQNPLHHKIVHRLEDWEYSSFKDYAGLRNGSLCNQSMAKKVIDIDWKNFIPATYEQYANKNFIEAIF